MSYARVPFWSVVLPIPIIVLNEHTYNGKQLNLFAFMQFRIDTIVAHTFQKC